MRCWPLRTTALAAVWSVAGGRALPAQLASSLEAGASYVTYDGFLPSAAYSVASALSVDGTQASFAARGSYLVFQSGNRSVQGSFAGSLFTPASGAWRGEVALLGGVSTYEQFARYGYVHARARAHVVGRREGLWLGATGGHTDIGAAGETVWQLAAGGWRQLAPATVALSAGMSRIGDTTYTDFEGSAAVSRGAIQFDLSSGVRAWSRGGGRGAYGEAVATAWLSRYVALVVSGGRYPSDPVRGSIAGRYASVALRIARRQAARFGTGAVTPLLESRSGPFRRRRGPPAARPAFEARPLADGSVILRLRAPGAASVEVMGDFTDWQPVALVRGDGDRWEICLTIPAGPHRINVRLDGGAWHAPAGTTPVADDFGGTVGLFLITAA